MKKLFVFILLFYSRILHAQLPVQDSSSPWQPVGAERTMLPGQYVQPLQVEEQEPFVNGFAKVMKNGKWNFADLSGKILGSTWYDQAFNFHENRAAVARNNKWGFIDETGREIITCQYDIVFNFSEGRAEVYDDLQWMLIDRAGGLIRKNIRPSFMNRSELAGKEKVDFLISSPADYFLTNAGNQPAADQPRTNGTCPANISFETGTFNNWNCFTGSVQCVNGVSRTTVNPSSPTPNRHTLITRSAVPVVDPYGFFPVNSPNGSTYCIKLGNTSVGAQAERISYLIQVPANAADYTISYYYAVVFEDPSHSYCEQPRFSAKLFDPAANAYLPCGTFEYVSSSSIPGFSNSTRDPSVKYKPWAQAFINLSPYAGRTLNLEFTTDDCTQRGHWGYAYLDVGDDCNLIANIEYNCSPPHITTLTAPPGFQTYNWWNSDYTTTVGTGQILTLNPGVTAGTRLWVEVIPYSGLGCRDTLPVTISATYPTGSLAIPAATTVCEGIPVQLSASGGITYQWYLNNQPITGATGAVYAATQPGIYTVEVISALSCRSWATGSVVLNATAKPAANFSFPLVCAGTPLQFTNTTVQNSTGPVTWRWDFGDGTQSDLRDPVHTYATTGSYNVTLQVTPLSCPGLTSTVIKKVDTDKPRPGIRYPAINAMINSSIPLQARDIGTKYQWTPVAGLSNPLTRNPVFFYDRQTDYSIRITTSTGCVTTDTQLVRVFRQPDIFVPAAFTPNGDGQNDKLDVFYIGIGKLKYFRVFNRWGQLLYETKDPAQRWDGNFNGSRQPLETYVWVAEMQDEKGTALIRRGQTLLMR